MNKLHIISAHSQGFNHIYGGTRERQILQYIINPNTNPGNPYCVMRFIAESPLYVP